MTPPTGVAAPSVAGPAGGARPNALPHPDGPRATASAPHRPASSLSGASRRQHLDQLVLDRYPALEEALVNGGLAPLPIDPFRFNLAPRLCGPFPIGEKDLDNQVSYIAARPATIGALLDISSRVKSRLLEVTTLVRHTEYRPACGRRT